MGLKEIRAGLESRLQNISGMTVYGNPLESVSEMPCIQIIPVSGGGPVSFTGGIVHRLKLRVLVTLAQGFDEAQEELDGYLALTGANSVRATLNADNTVGSNANYAVMDGYDNYGGFEIPPGSQQMYLGAEITVEADENQ